MCRSTSFSRSERERESVAVATVTSLGSYAIWRVSTGRSGRTVTRRSSGGLKPVPADSAGFRRQSGPKWNVEPVAGSVDRCYDNDLVLPLEPARWLVAMPHRVEQHFVEHWLLLRTSSRFAAPSRDRANRSGDPDSSVLRGVEEQIPRTDRTHPSPCSFPLTPFASFTRQ